jgi:hypothetical protein
MIKVSAASRAYWSLMEEAVHLLSVPSGAWDGPIAGDCGGYNPK